MSVTTHLTTRLVALLEEHRIVVWYDCERAFADFASAFRAPGCKIILARSSTLRARREAEAVYTRMNESTIHAEARANLLLYVPGARGATPEAKQRDPFEVFALAGTAFGDKEAELLQSLARQAMPEWTVAGREFMAPGSYIGRQRRESSNIAYRHRRQWHTSRISLCGQRPRQQPRADLRRERQVPRRVEFRSSAADGCSQLHRHERPEAVGRRPGHAQCVPRPCRPWLSPHLAQPPCHAARRDVGAVSAGIHTFANVRACLA